MLLSVSRSNPTVISALVLAMSLPGDALLYPVLPAQHEAYGLSLLWVGILLSANRFVRIFGGNHLVAWWANRHGFRSLVISAAVLAAISTFVYGIQAGVFLFLAARIIWGLAYASLRTGVIGYATNDDSQSGRLLGIGSSIQEIGPLLALIGGPFLIEAAGVRDTFIFLSICAALSLAIAWQLPADSGKKEPSAGRLTVPGYIDLLVFATSLAVDGFFIVTIALILAGVGYTSSSVIQLAAGVIALRRLSIIILAPLFGKLADRAGLIKLFMISVYVVIGGLVLIALQFIYAGVIVLILGSAICASLAPAAAIRYSHRERLSIISSVTTWRDIGAATGALLGGVLVSYIDLYMSYALLAGLIGLVGIFGAGSIAKRSKEKETK